MLWVVLFIGFVLGMLFQAGFAGWLKVEWCKVRHMIFLPLLLLMFFFFLCLISYWTS